MKLHKDKSLFKDAVIATAQLKSIPEIYVEKDYWVTYALWTVFNDSIGEETVFKGGTALSKCFDLIERFSEDIDLIVIRNEGESNNQLTSKIRRITKVVSEVLPEVNVKGLTRKMGMNRKTAHSYSHEFSGNFGQIRDAIIIEASWLGYHEPYMKMPVSSLIYDMMIASGQVDMTLQFNLQPFEANVLDPRRTICEKIMSLVRFSYTERPIEDLKNKIRHTYDLNRLLSDKGLSEFFDSDDFESLLLKVAKDDVTSYKNKNEWLVNHPNEALIFSDLESVWNQLSPTYMGDFKDLVYGEFPNENDVKLTLERIRERLSTISWENDIK